MWNIFFGKTPSKGVNPDEVVAVGAAVQGAVLTDEIKGVIFLISIISLILIKAVDLLKKKSMPWTLIHSGEH